MAGINNKINLAKIRESQKALLGKLTRNFSNLTNSVAIGVSIKITINNEMAFVNEKIMLMITMKT